MIFLLIKLKILRRYIYSNHKKNEIIDSRAFSDFCGIESSNQVPDGDTIGRFRNLLINNGIHKKFFVLVVETLKKRGLLLRKGTIVDSTIIEAPSSTKNKDKKRDSGAHSVKKGSAWHFGCKAHIGVDKDTGIVRDIVVTAVNVHDAVVTQDLLTCEEEIVYGDSGYLGAEKRENAVTNMVGIYRVRCACWLVIRYIGFFDRFVRCCLKTNFFQK